ncbi:metallophosphoesterase family protein [Xanthobacter sp. AM11]|uniref:metallophosphoesterase family protein n=1 Tax=Xanthobacter sp. AM11 TaxID=3380643 RepID=UPI0039BED8A3
MPAPAFSFLHAADIHLDSPLRGLARRGAQAAAFLDASRRALENLVEAAISQRVAFLLIAGDVYDSDWKDYATGQVFVRQMGRLARAGIRVFVIRGNHDAASTMSRDLPLPENVHLFPDTRAETVRLPDFEVALHGRGFPNRAVPENVARTYPAAVAGAFNIGLLHTSLTGREGHNTYAPCTVEELAGAGYDYWALGHIHRREVVLQHPAIVFPGNLQGRHARETGPKGATLVQVAGGRITGMEALTLDAARFEHAVIDLAGVGDEAEIALRARAAIAAAVSGAEGRPLALRLSFSGETPLHAHLVATAGQVGEEMQAHAYEVSADVLIEKVRLDTRAPRTRGEPAVAGFDAILAEVAADPDFRADIAAILADLRSKTPAEALDLMERGVADALRPEEADLEAVLAAARDEILSGLCDVAPDAEAGR